MARKNGKTTKQRQADKAARAAAAPPKPERKKREEMNASEVKAMRAAGQQRQDNRTKKTIRAGKREQQAKRDANGAARSAQYKDPTGLGISRKDLFSMQAQAMQGPETWSSQNLGRGKGFPFDD